MTQIKVSDLTNTQLDEWVARARGWKLIKDELLPSLDKWNTKLTIGTSPEITKLCRSYSPTSNPAQWADLIEEFGLSPQPHIVENSTITSWACSRHWPCKVLHPMIGPSLGQAICRAVVASVYGEYVEVGDE